MKKWLKKTVAIILTAAMAMSAGMPALASEYSIPEASQIFINEGMGLYKRINSHTANTFSITNNDEVEMLTATSTTNEEIYKISETEYLLHAYDNFYTVASKVELNPTNYSANEATLEAFEISDALKNDIAENIEREQNNNNTDFSLSLYVPEKKSDVSTYANPTTEQVVFAYGDHLMRRYVVEYENCTVGPARLSGTNTKNVADSAINLILSTVGLKYKEISIAGAAKSLLDYFVAAKGEVLTGTPNDYMETTVVYDKHTKQLDWYNPYYQDWEEGSLTRWVNVTKHFTVQYYSSVGQHYTHESTINEEYTSEHYDDYDFAIQMAPTCYIDPYIYGELYGYTLQF